MAFTFFFRDLPILESAADMFVADTVGRSRARIWDAGCAMGPELYTILILLAEKMGRFSFKNLIVDATDIDEGGDFGQTIREGKYPVDLVSRIPPEYLDKYFKKCDDGKNFQIDELLRERVRFQKHDLLHLKAPGTGYSLIVCKNVLLHFPEEKRVEVLHMFSNALAENGILAVEHTQKMPEECNQIFEKATGSMSVFRKKD